MLRKITILSNDLSNNFNRPTIFVTFSGLYSLAIRNDCL